MLDAGVQQLIGVDAVEGAGEDLDMGEMLACRFDDAERLLAVVDAMTSAFASWAPAASSRSEREASP